MDICANGHDEIVYTGRFCPVCETNHYIETKENAILELEDKIEELKDKIQELESELQNE